jgi:hypothetical protein
VRSAGDDTASGASNELCESSFGVASVRAVAAVIRAPPRAISASRGWSALGFTTVSVRVLSFRDADPANPQNVVGWPLRVYDTRGATNSVRTASAPM